MPSPTQKPVTRPKILGVAHLAVFVSDLAKARAFYEDFLGFEEPFTLPKPDGIGRDRIRENQRSSVDRALQQAVGG